MNALREHNISLNTTKSFFLSDRNRDEGYRRIYKLDINKSWNLEQINEKHDQYDLYDLF